MSDGPGADSRGSTWDNPSWSSSLSDSSLSGRPEDQPPNPWSRQASQPEATSGPGPAPAPSAPPSHPYAPSEPAGFEPLQPGFDPQPTPPYGGAPPYADPGAAYGPPPPYATPPPAYGSNPYEANPYQSAYGVARPYGVMPVSHPQSSTALVFGILGVVLAFSCIVGGFLGIAGIVQGRKARNEIDAEPGRYTGRSQAVAGIVTGTIGVVFAVLLTGFLVVAIVAGVLTEGA